MDVQLRGYTLNLILILIFLINFSSTKISDLRLCGDPACKDPVSRGRTVIRYYSNDKRILSFLPNKDVIIYGKEAGSRPDLWDVEIDGLRGYAPKKLIQEIGVIKRDLMYKVPTEEGKETASNIPADFFNEKDQSKQNVLQGKDTSTQEQSERTDHEASRQTMRDSVTVPDVNPSSPTGQSFEASAVPQPVPSMPQQDNSLPMPTQTSDQEGLTNSYFPQDAVRTSFSSVESTLATTDVEQTNSEEAKFTVIDGTTFPLDEDLIMDISTSASVSHVELPKVGGRVSISPSARLPPSTPDHLPQQNDANWGKPGLDDQPPVRPPENVKDHPPGSASDEPFSVTIRASPVQHNQQPTDVLDELNISDGDLRNQPPDHSDLPGNGEGYAAIGTVEKIGSYFKNIFGGQDDSGGVPRSQPETDLKQASEDFDKDSSKYVTGSEAHQNSDEKMKNENVVEEEKPEQNLHRTLPTDDTDNTEESNNILEAINDEETKVEVEDVLGNLVSDSYVPEEKKETIVLKQNEDHSREQLTHPDTGGLNPNPGRSSVDIEKQSEDEKLISFLQDSKLSGGNYSNHGSNGSNHSPDETQGVFLQDQKEKESIPPFRLAEKLEKQNDISEKGTPVDSGHAVDITHNSLDNDVPESPDGNSQKHSADNLSLQKNSHTGLSDDDQGTSLKEDKSVLEEQEYTSEETTLNNSPVSDHHSKPSSMLMYAVSSETGEPVPNQHILFPDQSHELVDTGGKSLPGKISSEEKGTEETSIEYQKDVAEEIVEETATVNGEPNPEKEREDEVTGEGYNSKEEDADETFADEAISEVRGENFTYDEASDEEDTVDNKSNPKEVKGEETVKDVSNSSEDMHKGNTDDDGSHQREEEEIFDDKSNPGEKMANNTIVDEIKPAEEVIKKFSNNEFNLKDRVVNESHNIDQVESKDNQVPNNEPMSSDREQVDKTDAGNEDIQLKRHDISDSDTREAVYFNEQEKFSNILKKELNFGKPSNLESSVGLNAGPAQSFKEPNNLAFSTPEKKSSDLDPVGAIPGLADMEVSNHADKLKLQELYRAKNDFPDSVRDDHKPSTDYTELTSSTLSKKSNYLDPAGAVPGSAGVEENIQVDKLKHQEPYQSKNDVSPDVAETTTSTVSQSGDSLDLLSKDYISNPLPTTIEPPALEESEVGENLNKESDNKEPEMNYCFTHGLDSENDCLHNHNEEPHRGFSKADVHQLQEETTHTSFTLEDIELLAREYLLSLKHYLQMMIDMLPEPIQAALADLEKSGLSPRVTVFLTIFATSSVLLIISFWIIKRGMKDRLYLQKLCFQEKIVFTVSKERDIAKEELEAAKKQITSLEQSWLEQQNAMEPLQQELEKNKRQNTQLQELMDKFQKELDSNKDMICELQLVSQEKQEENKILTSQAEKSETTVVSLERKISELTEELSSANREVANLQKTVEKQESQIFQLETTKSQLLTEAEMWNDRVNELSKEVEAFQEREKQLEEALSSKSKEMEVVKKTLYELQLIDKLLMDGSSAVEVEEKFALMADVTKAKKETEEAMHENTRLSIELSNERQKVQEMEGTLQEKLREVDQLWSDYNKALQDKTEAQTKLDVLTSYFKEKEMQLQRELGAQEVMRQRKEKDASSAERHMALIEQENSSYKAQLATMKQEMDETQRNSKNQIAAEEKKAHDNWLAARAAERKLEEAKQEAASLRQRLTLLERDRESFGQTDGVVKPISTKSSQFSKLHHFWSLKAEGSGVDQNLLNSDEGL
ncbi:uncharacterized protein LOC143226776 isoform X2 [Tachypleus tridentatus]|uniref:uncharacterized protein LOC143226776 isoform X2 n=1 Tax=Tachypleus tridentatus TaxID=6853 RepID=UPI003FD075EC